ncbi:MAG: hypothetical protein GY811_10480 [Myxococcales bacterium]|nr:hypothetical protein [Myxococcales bacterium]
MASILVFMNRRGADLTPRSKGVLAHARRIASHLGATLYAIAAENDEDSDTWIAEAGLAGADKVVLLSFEPATCGDARAGEQELGLLAAAVMAVADALSPNLFLLDDDATGGALAPALAGHLAAHVLEGAESTLTQDGDVILEARTPDRSSRRLLSLTNTEAPIVATPSAAAVSATHGQDDADVIFFKAPRYPVALATTVAPTPRGRTPEPALDGPTVVCAGLLALPVLESVRALADLLGAPLVFTKNLAEELAGHGEIANGPVVDTTEDSIAPTLYLTCGASGNDGHLGAIALGTKIVSQASCPRNRALRAARYVLLGDVVDTVPAIVRALRAQAQRTSFAEVAQLTRPAVRIPADPTVLLPCPDAVELFSEHAPLLECLKRDRLWIP